VSDWIYCFLNCGVITGLVCFDVVSVVVVGWEYLITTTSVTFGGTLCFCVCVCFWVLFGCAACHKQTRKQHS
jgi:hypothetical protein